MLNKFKMLRFLTFVRNDISPYYDTVPWRGESPTGKEMIYFLFAR